MGSPTNSRFVEPQIQTDPLPTVLGCVSTVTAQTLMPLPAYGRTFTGSVRGYYFTAPVDFTIVGLRVPDELGNGLQSVEVVRFDGATPPPPFSGTTNAFVSLARFIDEPSANILAVNIPVLAGEVIGIYGQASGANSYAGVSGPFTSEIFGFPTDLTRSGMQARLNSGPMANIWSEAAGPVARVEMYYIPAPGGVGLLAMGLIALRRRR